MPLLAHAVDMNFRAGCGVLERAWQATDCGRATCPGLFCAHLQYSGAYQLPGGRVAVPLHSHGGRQAGRFAPAFFAHLQYSGAYQLWPGGCGNLALAWRATAGRFAPAFFARIRKMVRCPTPTARTALSPPLPGALPVRHLRQGIASDLSCDFAREDSLRIQVDMA